MARAFGGSPQYLQISKNYLGSNSGPFTIALWARPATLAGSNTYLLQCKPTGAGSEWGVIFEYVNNAIEFYASSYGGTNPRTDSGITLDADDVTDGCWLAYRYTGQGGEWSKWKNGAKTVINAAINFTMPAAGTQFNVGTGTGIVWYLGDIAEVALWQAALSDEQMAELHAGVAADAVAPGGCLAYWPLRGHSLPELNYAISADVLVVPEFGSAPTLATHPTIVPPKHADAVNASWVVDLQHDSAPIRTATRDLSDYLDMDVLGDFYAGTLADDIRMLEQLPDTGAGVQLPANTVVSLINSDDAVTHGQEWRNVPVTIRYYDAISHALTTEFVGVIVDVAIANNRAVFTCSSQDSAVLEQLIPRQVIEITDGATGIIDDEEGNDTRTDLGAPIPVPCGTGGILTAPFIGVGTGGSISPVAGQDVLVGFGAAYTVRKVWVDYDPNAPGYELVTQWETAPGSPAYVTASSFSVSQSGGALDSWYGETGRGIRHADAGGTVSYATITGGTVTANAGTVNLSAPILTNPIGTTTMCSNYIQENTRYKYVGAGGTTFCTSLRYYGQTSGSILLEVQDRGGVAGAAARGNPAETISFILSDPDVGLGESVDAASFTAAAAAFTAAGLGSAVRGVIGDDKTQRRAIDVINELCWFRGARVWKDAASGEWQIEVDAAPTEYTDSLEFGDATLGNIAEVLSIRRTPLDQAVSTLKLRYGKSGRDRGAKPLELVDYAYTAQTTVTAIGGERVMVSPWLRSLGSHLEAATVCYYNGKRLASEDRQIEFRMQDHSGRRIALGAVYPVSIKTSPGVTLGGSYRIISRERTLTSFTFVAAGAYTANTYATDASTINAAVATPSGDANPDEREIGLANDANLIVNSDFTVGLADALSSPLDSTTVPGWWIVTTAVSDVTSMACPRDPLAKGGAYLEMVLPGGGTAVVLRSADTTGNFTGGLSVVGGQNYIFSVYCNRGGNFYFQVDWRETTGSSPTTRFPPMRVAPGDVDGLGHKRYYCIDRAPATAKFAVFSINLTPGATATTFRFNAVQAEEVTRLSFRPTPWHPNAQTGLQPAQVADGSEILFRSLRDKRFGVGISSQGGSIAYGLSGGTVTVGTAPVGMLVGLTARVTAGITGLTAGWNLSLSHGGGTYSILATGLGTATNTLIGDADLAAALPIFMSTATPIVARPVGFGETFGGGTIKVGVGRLRNVEPAST